MKKRHILLRLIFIILNNLYGIPPYLMWMLLIRPLKYIYRPLYYYIEGIMYSWLLEMVSFWIHSNNVIVHEAGDSISDCYSKHCLVISNHQSTSDVPLLMYYMSSKAGVVSRVCWIMNIMFKYTNFGWVSQLHHDFFIKEGKATRDQQIGQLKIYLEDIYIRLNRKWLILFPEGGFFYKRKEVSKRYALKHGFPDLEYCSLPRTGALQAILSTLMPQPGDHAASSKDPASSQEAIKLRSSLLSQQQHLDLFIDLTILYPNGDALSIFDLICRLRVEPLHVVFVMRKFNVSELASLSDAQFQDWFFCMWKQKDMMMEVFYKEGTIVDLNKLQADAADAFSDAKEATFDDEKSKMITSEMEIKEEENHSSDGEEGYHGIDTEFLESFKRSWSEVEEEGIEKSLETMQEYKSAEVKGLRPQDLPHISMSYPRVIAQHFFFLASIYLHYFLIKILIHSLIEYSLLMVG